MHSEPKLYRVVYMSKGGYWYVAGLNPAYSEAQAKVLAKDIYNCDAIRYTDVLKSFDQLKAFNTHNQAAIVN